MSSVFHECYTLYCLTISVVLCGPSNPVSPPIFLSHSRCLHCCTKALPRQCFQKAKRNDDSQTHRFHGWIARHKAESQAILVQQPIAAKLDFVIELDAYKSSVCAVHACRVTEYTHTRMAYIASEVCGTGMLSYSTSQFNADWSGN